jgi:hypothetical protein
MTNTLIPTTRKQQQQTKSKQGETMRKTMTSTQQQTTQNKMMNTLENN